MLGDPTKKNKFRGWNNFEQRFYTESEMEEIGGYYYTNGLSAETESYPLQQFTGYRDCDNKEIYEGDAVLDLNEDTTFVVTDIRNLGFYSNNSSSLPFYKVVGNIYENPEDYLDLNGSVIELINELNTQFFDIGPALRAALKKGITMKFELNDCGRLIIKQDK